MLSERKSVTSNELREVLKMLRNPLLFGGHAAAQVNARRKEALRVHLNPQLRQLCSPNNAVTNLLFGDDLSKQLETIEKTNKVKNSLSSQGFFSRDRAQASTSVSKNDRGWRKEKQANW